MKLETVIFDDLGPKNWPKKINEVHLKVLYLGGLYI